MKIKLTQDKHAIVDENVFPFLNKYKWYADKNGNTYYARRGVLFQGKIKSTYMHHCIIGQSLLGMQCDHIDGDGLNNQKSNLRIVTVRENSHNRKTRREGLTTSKYIGISWNKRSGKWMAQIMINSKCCFLGCYDKEKEAMYSYRKKLQSYLSRGSIPD